MKKYTEKNRYLNLISLLTLTFLVLILFIKMQCGVDLDETSLLTGECNFNEIHATFDPNPITIVAGESAQVELDLVVLSNCEDHAKFLYVDMNDETPPPPDEDVIYVYNGLINNSGVCSFTLDIPPNSPLGSIQKELKIYVSSEVDYSGTKKSIIATLNVNVISSSPDFSINIQGTLSLYEGKTSTYKYIDLIREGNHNDDITLSIKNKPDSVSITFNPNPVPDGVNAVEMIMDADYEAVPGVYQPTLVAYDNTIEKEYTFDLEVLNQYTISTNPETISIAQDTSAIVDVDIDWGHSEVYNEMIFTIEGSIIGIGSNAVAATFEPNPLPWGTFSNELTLEVGATVPPGNYPLTIKGATSNLEKSTVLQLTVTEP